MGEKAQALRTLADRLDLIEDQLVKLPDIYGDDITRRTDDLESEVEMAETELEAHEEAEQEAEDEDEEEEEFDDDEDEE